jgi:hypothetical protein
VARGKKTGGKDFYKGQPGGPGRPPLPEDIKKARELNKDELTRVLNDFIYLSKGEIEEKILNSSTPMLELLVASILKKGIDFGDHMRLSFLLDRLVGKVKEVVEHEGEGFRVIVEDYTGKK